MNVLEGSRSAPRAAAPRTRTSSGPSRPAAPGRLTLPIEARLALAPWAADCAERVLDLFEAAVPTDPRPREALAGIRAFGAGDLGVGAARALSAAAHAAARSAGDLAASAAARAAGHAVATAHMGAHARGAAAYAARAAEHAHPDDPRAAAAELDGQVRRLTPAARAALRRLPPVSAAGGGDLGRHIRELDAAIRKPDRDSAR